MGIRLRGNHLRNSRRTKSPPDFASLGKRGSLDSNITVTKGQLSPPLFSGTLLRKMYATGDIEGRMPISPSGTFLFEPLGQVQAKRPDLEVNIHTDVQHLAMVAAQPPGGRHMTHAMSHTPRPTGHVPLMWTVRSPPGPKHTHVWLVRQCPNAQCILAHTPLPTLEDGDNDS